VSVKESAMGLVYLFLCLGSYFDLVCVHGLGRLYDLGCDFVRGFCIDLLLVSVARFLPFVFRVHVAVVRILDLLLV
jgi:hypothetical protein